MNSPRPDLKIVSTDDRFSEISSSIYLLSQKVSDSFDYMRDRMDGIENKLDTRIDDLKGSVESMCKVRHEAVDATFEGMKAEMDSHKSWGKYKVTVLVGIMATVVSSVLTFEINGLLKAHPVSSFIQK